jgi:hypothetical protein
MFKFNAMSENKDQKVEKKEQPLMSPSVKFDVDEFNCKVIITYDFVNPSNIAGYMDIYKDNKSDKGNLALIKEETIDFMGIKIKIGGYVQNVVSSLSGWKQYLETFEHKKNAEKAKVLSEYETTAKKYADCVVAGKAEEAERHLRKLQELKEKVNL